MKMELHTPSHILFWLGGQWCWCVGAVRFVFHISWGFGDEKPQERSIKCHSVQAEMPCTSNTFSPQMHSRAGHAAKGWNVVSTSLHAGLWGWARILVRGANSKIWSLFLGEGLPQIMTTKQPPFQLASAPFWFCFRRIRGLGFHHWNNHLASGPSNENGNVRGVPYQCCFWNLTAFPKTSIKHHHLQSKFMSYTVNVNCAKADFLVEDSIAHQSSPVRPN